MVSWASGLVEFVLELYGYLADLGIVRGATDIEAEPLEQSVDREKNLTKNAPRGTSSSDGWTWNMRLDHRQKR